MRPLIPTRHLIANIVLAALLVAAQLGAAVHAFEHKAGTPQAKVCATCVAAANLGSAAVGEPATLLLEPAPLVFAPARGPALLSVTLPAARQRGPPLPRLTP